MKVNDIFSSCSMVSDSAKNTSGIHQYLIKTIMIMIIMMMMIIIINKLKIKSTV